MRVLFVVHGYPPRQLGGTEVHTQTVARDLGARGHDVSVLAADADAPARSSVDHVLGDVPVRRLGVSSDPGRLRPLVDPWVRAEFERVLEQFKPEVVHVQHLLGLSGDLIEAARRRSIPTVVTLHDHWLQCPEIHPRPGSTHPRGRFWGLGCVWHHELGHPRRTGSRAIRGEVPGAIAAAVRRPAFLRRQLTLADLVLAPSRFICREYVRFGVSPKKIHFMPHGVRVGPARGVPKREGPVRFGFVGSIVPVKGVHVLCKAFARLGGDATLQIHGRAYDERYWRRIERSLGSKIRYVGPFAPENAAGIYAAFDVLVLPSLFPETFALTVAEAQACGMPAIASRVGALPERISDGRDGLLVPPGDAGALRRALVRLLDPAKVDGLAARVEPPRSTDAYADELEQLYAGLVNGAGREVSEANFRG